MATWTNTVRVEAPALPAPRPRRAARRAPRRRVAGGVVWIGLLTALLVGVVALNVAVLRLNMQLEQLDETRLELEAKNAQLASDASSGVAPPVIERRARNELGLVPAADPTYADLNDGP
jgi:cell division protein FtsB